MKSGIPMPATMAGSARDPDVRAWSFRGRLNPSNDVTQNKLRDEVAGGLGFEPRLTESESAVLPLNYPPIANDFNNLKKPANLSGNRADHPTRQHDASTSRASRAAFQASMKGALAAPNG